jgi:predicted secreted acid phosphatase
MIEPYNLDFLKTDVISYVDSGQYYSDIKSKITEATIILNANIGKPNICVIFDLDETLISEYQFMVKNNFAWTNSLIEEAQTITTFPTLPSVKMFFDYCTNKSIFTVVLTSRRVKQLDATMELLTNAGYIALGRLIMRPDDDNGTIQQFKRGKRDLLVKEGYEIILNIGDQESDLVDDVIVSSETSGLRKYLLLPPNAIKLPNPFYFISCFD